MFKSSLGWGANWKKIFVHCLFVYIKVPGDFQIYFGQILLSKFNNFSHSLLTKNEYEL